MARKRRWIQKAIKKRGALKAWLKRNERKIVSAIKDSVFDKEGDIKVTALRKLRRTKLWDRLSSTTKRRINLAITLHKLRKR